MNQAVFWATIFSIIIVRGDFNQSVGHSHAFRCIMYYISLRYCYGHSLSVIILVYGWIITNNAILGYNRMKGSCGALNCGVGVGKYDSNGTVIKKLQWNASSCILWKMLVYCSSVYLITIVTHSEFSLRFPFKQQSPLFWSTNSFRLVDMMLRCHC